MNAAYNQHYVTAERMRDKEVATQIKQQLDANLPAIDKDNIKLMQDLFSRSSFANPINIDTKTKASDERFNFYNSDDGSKYAVYKADGGLNNGQALVYKYDQDNKATRVDNDLASRIYRQS